MTARWRSDDDEELTDEEIGFLPPEEARAFFDKRCRELLGMSADEFIAKLESGEIVDDDTDWRIGDLIMLLPFAGRDITEFVWMSFRTRGAAIRSMHDDLQLLFSCLTPSNQIHRVYCEPGHRCVQSCARRCVPERADG